LRTSTYSSNQPLAQRSHIRPNRYESEWARRKEFIFSRSMQKKLINIKAEKKTIIKCTELRVKELVGTHK
jgi:hypothetical protein